MPWSSVLVMWAGARIWNPSEKSSTFFRSTSYLFWAPFRQWSIIVFQLVSSDLWSRQISIILARSRALRSWRDGGSDSPGPVFLLLMICWVTTSCRNASSSGSTGSERRPSTRISCWTIAFLLFSSLFSLIRLVRTCWWWTMEFLILPSNFSDSVIWCWTCCCARNV